MNSESVQPYKQNEEHDKGLPPKETKSPQNFEDFTSSILKLSQTDQEARQNNIPEETYKIDKQNQEALKLIIEEIGWPTKSKVGEEAAHAAWLLVQHADTDPGFQKECFSSMREAGEKEVSPEDLAYLADRIRVNEGKPQLFGTQWKIDPEKGYIPEEIEDPTNLDKRREEVGMEPFQTYAEEMKRIYEEWKSKQV